MKTLIESSQPQSNCRIQLLSLCIVLAGMLIADRAQAQPLNDPTQPPASLYEAADGSSAHEVAGPVLQSVLLGRHYSAAIISGEKVMLGGKYAQSTLIKLNDREALLRHADQSTEILVLNPIISKKAITSPTEPVATNKSLASKSTSEHMNQAKK